MLRHRGLERINYPLTTSQLYTSPCFACAPSNFHGEDIGEDFMKYHEYKYDSDYSHHNDKAHQLFCVQLFDWIANISEDTRINRDMIDSASDKWSNLYHNQYCDSPIEYLLMAALFFQTNGYEYLQFIEWDFIEWNDGKCPESDMTSFVIPQSKIGKYRVDFLIRTRVVNEVHQVIIECDGHNYHDKTKEQATKDKRRDREITALGIPVLRFTGSDIYKRPLGCADEISLYLSNSIEKSLKLQGLV